MSTRSQLAEHFISMRDLCMKLIICTEIAALQTSFEDLIKNWQFSTMSLKADQAKLLKLLMP